MQQIERGIFYDIAYLGVTLGGLVYPHGTIMIDAPLRPEDARSWRSALLNQRGGANRLLVNLDAHPDRTLGDRVLDSTIITHQKAAQVFRNRPTIFKGQTVETGAAWEAYPDAIGMRWANPDITFVTQMSLHWGGPEVLVEYHPGPAPGASWVTIPDSKVAFVGDAVVVDQPPFLAHAYLPEWLETLDLLESNYTDYLIVSGRGGPATSEGVRKLHDFLEQVSLSLKELAERNAAVEEVENLAIALLEEFPSDHEKGEVFLDRLRFGLRQYYTRQYRSGTAQETIEIEEEEE